MYVLYICVLKVHSWPAIIGERGFAIPYTNDIGLVGS